MSNSPMFYGATPTIFRKAAMLRRNMTKEEKILWGKLRDPKLFDLKWRRQHPIFIYVADFYCHSKKLVIEVDGDDHKYKKESDMDREELMKGMGITTVRFPNESVITELEKVILKIKNTMETIEQIN